jgi:hypothetical protein
MVFSLWRSFVDFLTTRAWNFYAFVPPLTSLLLTLFLIPFYERVLDAKLRAFLESVDVDYRKVSGVLKTRGLQTAYLTEIPAFLVAVWTTVEAQHRRLLQVSIGVMFVLYLLVSPKLFMRSEPDYVATEIPRWSKRLWKNGFAYLGFYSALLAILNGALICIIIATLPKK